MSPECTLSSITVRNCLGASSRSGHRPFGIMRKSAVSPTQERVSRSPSLMPVLKLIMPSSIPPVFSILRVSHAAMQHIPPQRSSLHVHVFDPIYLPALALKLPNRVPMIQATAHMSPVLQQVLPIHRQRLLASPSQLQVSLRVPTCSTTRSSTVMIQSFRAVRVRSSGWRRWRMPFVTVRT
jgi:hypothetical protein